MISEYRSAGSATGIQPHGNWLSAGTVREQVRRAILERRAMRAMTEPMRAFNPDVVYVNSLVSMPAARAAARLKIPCIWHLREMFEDVGGEMRIPPFGGRELLRKTLTRFATTMIAPSKAIIENLVGAEWISFVPVIPNAVACDMFDPAADDQCETRRRFGVADNAFVIGVPGTLRVVKGHEFFFKSVAPLIREDATVQVLVSGDAHPPEYRETLMQLVAQLGMQQRVQFVGSISRMSGFYAACDLICVPSRSESFGRTAIEAFAAGVAVIATNVGGLSEIIQSGHNGLLVEFDDVNAMSTAIRRLRTDDALRQRLAAAGRAKARTVYNEAAHAERIIGIVEAVYLGAKTKQRA